MTEIRDGSEQINDPVLDLNEEIGQLKQNLDEADSVDLGGWIKQLRFRGATDEQVNQLYTMIYKEFGMSQEIVEAAEGQRDRDHSNWAAIPTNQPGLWFRTEDGMHGPYLTKTTREELVKIVLNLRHNTEARNIITIADGGEPITDPTEPTEIAQQFIDELTEIPGSGHLSFFLKSYSYLPEDQLTAVKSLILQKLGVSDEMLADLKKRALELVNRTGKKGEASALISVPGFKLWVLRGGQNSQNITDKEGFIYRVVPTTSL